MKIFLVNFQSSNILEMIYSFLESFAILNIFELFRLTEFYNHICYNSLKSKSFYILFTPLVYIPRKINYIQKNMVKHRGQGNYINSIHLKSIIL
jgi:hypothetical protein